MRDMMASIYGGLVSVENAKPLLFETLKTLTIITGNYNDLYDKYQQQKMHGLDENLIKVNVIYNPENNKTTAEQRQIAQDIAKQINYCKKHKYKILLFTHSDYIIREFNALIGLNYCDEEKKERILYESYSLYDKDDLIDIKNICCYDIYGDTRLSIEDYKCKITKEQGIEVPSISDIIVKTNELLAEITFGE